MIITKIKPLDEILQYIENYDKILVLGCSECNYGCSTGVEEKVKEFAEKIKRERKKLGEPIKILEKILTKQCNPSALKPVEEFQGKVSAIISLGCGVGANLIADLYPKMEVYPGVNTLFLGAKIKEGYWVEKCRACGDCIIGYTAGLCPITRCPKNLLNGPCGGVKNGICEVRKNLLCIWYKIVMRLKNRGKLEKLMEIWEAKDWRLAGGEGVRELKEE
uniref:Methylene-tetrahydrofolate reductase C-terminal-like domain-containing protein n=1 Tax=Thermodesulfobacterium geofontis TaxID=1295609 RepID=A0A7V4JQU8_9BACT